MEIDDKELATLKGAQVLLDKLLKSPKTRRETEKLIKVHHPEVQTTEDVAEPYIQEVRAVTKRFDDYLKKQEDTVAESKFQTDIQHLKEHRSFTDDGIERLKKLMVEKSIPDIIVAADHYEKLHPAAPQAPSTFSPTGWGFGRKTDDASLKLLFEDEDAWAEQEARKAWDEEAKKGQILT